MTAFIFDIDGTIIDSMRHHERSWDVFLTQRGVPTVGEDFFRRTAGRTGIEVMRELFGPLSDIDAQAFVREKEGIYRELFRPDFREIAGFKAFAREAKTAGVRLACATADGAISFAPVSSRDELVLVIGGSSGTGRAAVQLLHGRGVPTRVASRDPVRAALQLPQGLNICAADITKPDTYRQHSRALRTSF